MVRGLRRRSHRKGHQHRYGDHRGWHSVTPYRRYRPRPRRGVVSNRLYTLTICKQPPVGNDNMAVQLTKLRFPGNGQALVQIAMGNVPTARIENKPVGKLDARIWLQHA
jgi:hypothetical protein